MAKEKKEVKEPKEEKVEKVEKKDYALDEKSQRNLKGFSKTLYIVAIVAKVFLIIALVAIGIVMVATPVVTSNIKTQPYNEVGNIKIFDKEIEYIKTEDKITLYEKDKPDDKTIVKGKGEVQGLTKVLEYLEESDMTKVTLFIEFELVVIVAIIIINIFVVKKARAFFKNIHDKDTPFTLENIDLLKGAIKLLCYTFIIVIVLGVINSVILEIDVNLNLVGLFEIFAVCCLQYIFEYGYKLQKETKGRIYSE